MLITARSWLGRRTFVYDQLGNRVLDLMSLNTRTRTATQFVRAPQRGPFQDKKPRILFEGGQVVTRVIDVTGFKLKFGNAEGFIKLGDEPWLTTSEAVPEVGAPAASSASPTR